MPRRLLLAAAAALCLTGTAVAQRPAPTAADTLEPDSAYRRAGAVLRWQVISRELIIRALAARQGRPARPMFYDGNNNTRLYALVAGAQYDALRAVLVPVERDAASAAAAAAVLGAVFPTERARLERELAAERTRLGDRGIDGASIRAGERAGRRAAARWVANAADEVQVRPWSGHVPIGPDRWRGEGGPPGLAISLALRPWFVDRPDRFRPPPPPGPRTAEFAAALAAVREATAHRTREQTRATWRWARNAATLWAEISGAVIVRRRLGDLEAARALMYLNMALSDATIVCWDAKLAYWSRRPSEVDPALDLSIPLPDFPSYPSAHATLFAAGAMVLGHLVPAEQVALDSLAAEATASRVWAGVHYPFDNDAGIRLGRRVAEAALAVLEAETP